MFKHITGGQWFVFDSKGAHSNTVWSQGGDVMVADCSTSKAISFTGKRANAKLISLAPSMYMALEDVLEHGLDDQARSSIKSLIGAMNE